MLKFVAMVYNLLLRCCHVAKILVHLSETSPVAVCSQPALFGSDWLQLSCDKMCGGAKF